MRVSGFVVGALRKWPLLLVLVVVGLIGDPCGRAWSHFLLNLNVRVLHVEHIELLHAPQRILRSHTRHDPITKLRQESAAQGPADIAPQDLIRRNLSRLHRILDLCGPIADREEVDGRPYPGDEAVVDAYIALVRDGLAKR